MEQLDLSTLSEEQLQAALAEKRKSKKTEEQRLRNAFEKDKNDFCNTSASKFRQMHNELSALKEYIITEANALYARLYQLNGQEPKETKSFTLKNGDDTVKVVADRQERFEFTDEAIVHINAIKETFYNKFAQRNKALYGLLDGLLIKNTKNDYDPKLLSKARSRVRELGDPELIERFDKLEDCRRVVGTALYCRVYVRSEKTQRWEDISLQFSSL
ncbi:MAG: DUF3164 family protein [Mangrovibacterium sp.]